MATLLCSLGPANSARPVPAVQLLDRLYRRLCLSPPAKPARSIRPFRRPVTRSCLYGALGLGTDGHRPGNAERRLRVASGGAAALVLAPEPAAGSRPVPTPQLFGRRSWRMLLSCLARFAHLARLRRWRGSGCRNEPGTGRETLGQAERTLFLDGDALGAPAGEAAMELDGMGVRVHGVVDEAHLGTGAGR
jgi:hypothetical protein